MNHYRRVLIFRRTERQTWFEKIRRPHLSESHDRICEVECCDSVGTKNEAHFKLTW